MIEEQNPNNEQQHEESINFYAIFFKYLAYWPWFVASVIVCLILAFVYLRYQAQVYNVTSAVLIKEDDSSKRGMGAASGALEAMQSLGGLSMSNNFDNEVEILKSRTLIRKVITQLGLYTSVSKSRMLGYNIPLYQSSPINVYMSPEEAEKLEAGAQLKLSYSPEGKLYVKVRYTLNEDGKDLRQTPSRIPHPGRCVQLYGKRLHPERMEG